MSFYGMIPERVYTITSMTLEKNKEYHTQIGDFFYGGLNISDQKFSNGLKRFYVKIEEEINNCKKNGWFEKKAALEMHKNIHF